MFERAVFIAVATFFCLHPAVLPSALAQDDEQPERREVAITGEQADLNDEAVRAIIGGDHAKAVALLNESLLSVEANVLYLNLGKAYQGLGNCEKARESFEAALEAPVVESPSPEVVDKKVRSSLQELDQECAAAPSEDDAGADVAVQDDTSEQKDTQEPKPAEEETPVAAAPVEESSSQDIWGMTLVGTGLAVAGGGAAMHLVARSKRAEITDTSSGETVPMTQREAADVEDSANLYDTVGLSMAITGGVLAATGTYIWLTAPEEAASTVQVGPTADGWNVAWTLQF
ncbi:MAG: hypothetical protein ACLFVJ_04725 [Persicimonas sp.]